MLFFALLVGLCASLSKAEDPHVFLRIYGLEGDTKTAFTAMPIRTSVADGEPYFLDFDKFTDQEPDYDNESFLLVYRPTEDADHLESYFIMHGIESLFRTMKPGPFNKLGALQKYLLSEDHYGFTPKLAKNLLPNELFKLPVTTVVTDHILIKTLGYLDFDTPVLYVVPKKHLDDKWMTKDVRELSAFAVTPDGFDKLNVADLEQRSIL